ncbi:DUF523 domain-containing protein [Marinobacter sp. OP 3.4]|uniref:DUF523 domain-containing protein n=1 Tax=Marinobacter sp. OP 3.4 TaxID=3076501 RepID=UPI002E20DA72
MAKILVSACLLGHEVRYDGGDLAVGDPRFRALQDIHQLVPFCPEVASGLPTPRAPAEITNGDGRAVLSGHARIIDTDRHDLTENFLTGARLALAQCQAEQIEFAILAEKSPSCGSNVIYDGSFTGTRVPGVGCTTALLRENGIKVFSQNDIDDLVTMLP